MCGMVEEGGGLRTRDSEYGHLLNSGSAFLTHRKQSKTLVDRTHAGASVLSK